MNYFRENDMLVKRDGYDVKDPWSRVVIVTVDSRLKQVGLLPHTTRYVKNFRPGVDGNFKVKWLRPEDVEADYIIEEHAK